jgi:glycerate kinase
VPGGDADAVIPPSQPETRATVRLVPRLLAAPDKFRGTATATQVAAAMAAAARAAGWDADEVPISDGGEGLLDCFGGADHHATVDGPLGAPVRAGWRLDGTRAVIEMAAASGLALVGERNDPLAASTRGTGQLIRAAIEAGARDVIVGAGGSATTDGGRGAVDALLEYAPLDGTRGVQVTVAADVRTKFVDAATVFAPQKGATPSDVQVLTEGLRQLARRYQDEFGIDVGDLDGAGAAGGLAGGLAALGASIRPGFELVAEQLDLPAAIATADLVLTGEGRLDPTSLQGKATGSIVDLCARFDVPVVVIAGQVADGFTPPFRIVDLTAAFGTARARTATEECVHAAAAAVLTEFRD